MGEDGLRVGAAVPNLTRWGLSADADLLYRSLTLQPEQSAGELVRDLGLARRRVDTALDELTTQGLAAAGTRPAGGLGWTACTPDRAVHTLRTRRFTPDDPLQLARDFLAATAALQLPEPRSAGARLVRQLQLFEVRGRLAELAALERHEHLTLQPGRSFSRETLTVGLQHDRDLAARGVRLRVVGQPPLDGDLGHAPGPDEPVGTEYRETDDVPLRAMVFDRKVALLAAGPRLEDGAIEVADPGVVACVIALFDRQWDQAVDPVTVAAPRLTLTGREKAVVDALAAGCTDLQAAQRLRLSVRTIGYVVRGLMDQYGVENRFQLGLVLGAAGAAAVPDDDLGASADLSA